MANDEEYERGYTNGQNDAATDIRHLAVDYAGQAELFTGQTRDTLRNVSATLEKMAKEWTY